MLNKIWFWLLCLGILYGFAKGAYQSVYPPPVLDRPAADAEPLADATPGSEDAEVVGVTAVGKELNSALLDAARTSVEISIGLIGIMALWLGLLNVAKDAGLVDAFARLMRPVMRLLFPEVPNGHPAQGAILMNFSANMLGLDNAATPMGLKAMRELQELNPVKDTATNAMAMFLAINTSGITIIPFTIIGYRALRGSQNPTEPLAGTLIVTAVSTTVAVVAAAWLSRRSRYKVGPEGDDSGNQATHSGHAEERVDE